MLPLGIGDIHDTQYMLHTHAGWLAIHCMIEGLPYACTGPRPRDKILIDMMGVCQLEGQLAHVRRVNRGTPLWEEEAHLGTKASMEHLVFQPHSHC